MDGEVKRPHFKWMTAAFFGIQAAPGAECGVKGCFNRLSLLQTAFAFVTEGK